MIADPNTMLDPESAEVLWDYCLERGIIAPGWIYSIRGPYLYSGIGTCTPSSNNNDNWHSTSDGHRRSVVVHDNRSNTGGSFVLVNAAVRSMSKRPDGYASRVRYKGRY